MSLLDQVTEQLAKIELKDDDISEYITGIIQDESIDDDEKREVITEFLAEATDKSPESLIDALLKEWKREQKEQEREVEEKRTKLLNDAKAREEERRLRAEQEKLEDDAKRTKQKELTKEEKAAREKLMREYAYVADGEDGNEKKNEENEPKDRRKNKNNTPSDPLLIANRNAEMIKEKEKIRRDQMKQTHEKEKERNKINLEKQRQDQKLDKEKKKTQKGERRR